MNKLLKKMVSLSTSLIMVLSAVSAGAVTTATAAETETIPSEITISGSQAVNSADNSPIIYTSFTGSAGSWRDNGAQRMTSTSPGVKIVISLADLQAYGPDMIESAELSVTVKTRAAGNDYSITIPEENSANPEEYLNAQYGDYWYYDGKTSYYKLDRKISTVLLNAEEPDSVYADLVVAKANAGGNIIISDEPYVSQTAVEGNNDVEGYVSETEAYVTTGEYEYTEANLERLKTTKKTDGVITGMPIFTDVDVTDDLKALLESGSDKMAYSMWLNPLNESYYVSISPDTYTLHVVLKGDVALLKEELAKAEKDEATIDRLVGNILDIKSYEYKTFTKKNDKTAVYKAILEGLETAEDETAEKRAIRSAITSDTANSYENALKIGFIGLTNPSSNSEVNKALFRTVNYTRGTTIATGYETSGTVRVASAISTPRAMKIAFNIDKFKNPDMIKSFVLSVNNATITANNWNQYNARSYLVETTASNDRAANERLDGDRIYSEYYDVPAVNGGSISFKFDLSEEIRAKIKAGEKLVAYNLVNIAGDTNTAGNYNFVAGRTTVDIVATYFNDTDFANYISANGIDKNVVELACGSEAAAMYAALGDSAVINSDAATIADFKSDVEGTIETAYVENVIANASASNIKTVVETVFGENSPEAVMAGVVDDWNTLISDIDLSSLDNFKTTASETLKYYKSANFKSLNNSHLTFKRFANAAYAGSNFSDRDRNRANEYEIPVYYKDYVKSAVLVITPFKNNQSDVACSDNVDAKLVKADMVKTFNDGVETEAANGDSFVRYAMQLPEGYKTAKVYSYLDGTTARYEARYDITSDYQQAEGDTIDYVDYFYRMDSVDSISSGNISVRLCFDDDDTLLAKYNDASDKTAVIDAVAYIHDLTIDDKEDVVAAVNAAKPINGEEFIKVIKGEQLSADVMQDLTVSKIYGKISGEITIVNRETESKPIFVTAALYDQGHKLIEARIYEESEIKKQSKAPFEFDFGDAKGTVVRVFCWNSSNGMVPYPVSASKTLEESEAAE